MPGIAYDDDAGPGPRPKYDEPSEPCPVSTFDGYLKQIDRTEVDTGEASFLRASFPGFSIGVEPPGAVTAALHAAYENRVPRRYDGDQTLPLGRYATVCQDASGNDHGTLIREMMFYMDPKAIHGHIEVFDSTLPEHVHAFGGPRDLPTLAMRYLPFGFNKKFAVRYAAELSIKKVCLDGILDLRRPDAATWLVRTISSLTFSFEGKRARVFSNRPDLKEFGQLLYGLLDQAKGGGNLHKITGLYLRQLGVAGLIYPSSRTDASVEFIHGTPTKHSGWTLVDFRNSPPAKICAFYEERPSWPTTLVLEGGDDNTPSAVAHGREVSILTEGYSIGTGKLSVLGLQRRMSAYHMSASALAAIRFRLPQLTDQDEDNLRRFLVSLSAESASAFSYMILYSVLGFPQAQDSLRRAINDNPAQPINGLLEACLNAPEPSKDQEKAFGDFLAKVFEGGKVVPEPAT